MVGQTYNVRSNCAIRDKLIEVRERVDGCLTFNADAEFYHEFEWYAKMQMEIDTVPTSLQTSEHSLAESRDDLDVRRGVRTLSKLISKSVCRPAAQTMRNFAFLCVLLFFVARQN